MKRTQRSDQRDGYVFEAYAEASSKVESLRKLADQVVLDPVKSPQMMELHRRARNEREQARKRLEPFADLCDELAVPALLTPERRKEIIKERDRLTGEIFIRLMHIDLAVRAAEKVKGN
jgi:hypothetical protein